jgi:hypothetical protein
MACVFCSLVQYPTVSKQICVGPILHVCLSLSMVACVTHHANMVLACMLQVAALKQELAAKTSEAESLSRRVGAVNSLTTAFEQVT